MGIYVNGLLGAFSGKVGNVVGSNWRSIDYMRSRPKPSKNRLISNKQKQIQLKFSNAYHFLNPLREFLALSYPIKKGSKKSAFNMAMANVISSIEGSHLDFRFNYQNIQLSKGNLSPVQGVFSLDENDILNLNWKSKISIGTAEDTDIVYIILYEEQTKEFYIIQGSERGNGRCEIDLEKIGKGIFQIWTSVSTYDSARFSNSSYHGMLKYDKK